MKNRKIRFLSSIAGNEDPRYDLRTFGFQTGDLAELHPDLAAAWIASGIAEDAAPATAAPKKK
jgi:hypothetical protein